MTTDKYRVPVDERESQSRVAHERQVQAHGDGMGPPAVPLVGPLGDDADGDSD